MVALETLVLYQERRDGIMTWVNEGNNLTYDERVKQLGLEGWQLVASSVLSYSQGPQLDCFNSRVMRHTFQRPLG